MSLPVLLHSSSSYSPAPAIAPGTITRYHEPGFDAVLARRDGLTEFHLTVQPVPGEHPGMMLLRLDTFLREHQAIVAQMEVFGASQCFAPFTEAMQKLLGETCWPIMWVDGASFGTYPIAGLHVLALAGVEVETLRIDGRPVATLFSDQVARHCLIGDIRPTNLHAPRDRQAREVFENLALTLEIAQMQPSDLARTWLYLDNLLDWYGDLNRVRTQIFNEWDLFAAGVPASTGIGAQNPHGAAMIAGAWATTPHFGYRKTVREVASPLQCPAPKYGSSFARAMEWDAPDHRRLTVSGTASIAPDGTSAHLGNIEAQVDLTMDVVEAILAARGSGFSDVTRATAYIKDPRDAGCLEEWFERTGAPRFPAIATHTQVCRDELLFEIELDTILPARSAGAAK
jgi:enamine deaminase RidA (YjgF/YER057c/UK114 family)